MRHKETTWEGKFLVHTDTDCVAVIIKRPSQSKVH